VIGDANVGHRTGLFHKNEQSCMTTTLSVSFPPLHHGSRGSPSPGIQTPSPSFSSSSLSHWIIDFGPNPGNIAFIISDFSIGTFGRCLWITSSVFLSLMRSSSRSSSKDLSAFTYLNNEWRRKTISCRCSRINYYYCNDNCHKVYYYISIFPIVCAIHVRCLWKLFVSSNVHVLNG